MDDQCHKSCLLLTLYEFMAFLNLMMDILLKLMLNMLKIYDLQNGLPVLSKRMKIEKVENIVHIRNL